MLHNLFAFREVVKICIGGLNATPSPVEFHSDNLVNSRGSDSQISSSQFISLKFEKFASGSTTVSATDVYRCLLWTDVNIPPKKMHVLS